MMRKGLIALFLVLTVLLYASVSYGTPYTLGDGTEVYVHEDTGKMFLSCHFSNFTDMNYYEQDGAIADLTSGGAVWVMADLNDLEEAYDELRNGGLIDELKAKFINLARLERDPLNYMTSWAMDVGNSNDLVLMSIPLTSYGPDISAIAVADWPGYEPIPEPSIVSLLVLGFLGLIGCKKKNSHIQL
jgi:hypothetical protein